jgi:putative N6-adenine-specific DNA methylase
MKLTMCSPCLFGLEGPLAAELRRMGAEDVRAENGRVYFSGTEETMAKANIRLRFGERVLIELGSFPAATFDELYEGVRALSWERFIPRNGAFPVKGHSLDSKLTSIPSCQKIVKKAVVDRLTDWYDISWFREDGATYQIQFAIMKDTAYLYLDTSGVGLHKRGYRPAHVAAPLRETLASAMVDLARYRGRGDFCDPFCGSGTIAIEAALAAKGRAPGINRSFTAETWKCFKPEIWQAARDEARAREFNGDYRIFASDIDPEAVAIARKNAARAGVEDIIEFSVADATKFDRVTEGGVIVTNPPYGERLLEKQSAEALYKDFGAALRALPEDNWKKYILSSHVDFERGFGARADKKRKLYNGMIKCELYMYL